MLMTKYINHNDNYVNFMEAQVKPKAILIDSFSSSQIRNELSPFNNEKGTALVLTMFVLVLISIMGVFFPFHDIYRLEDNR